MSDRIIAKGVKKERTWLLPNWSELEKYRDIDSHNDFRDALHLTPGTILALYAGNMGEKQGLESVLEAAAKLRETSRIQFLMVGGGTARSRLEQRAEDMGLENLKFLPVQPLEKLPKMLSAGDIHLVVQKRSAADLVMPSKLTNILAAGKPCVATADPGTTLADTVREYQTGLVTPPEDSTALSEAILTLSDNPDLRLGCGQAARAYAEQYLDQDSILKDFESKLSSLINKDEYE